LDADHIRDAVRGIHLHTALFARLVAEFDGFVALSGFSAPFLLFVAVLISLSCSSTTRSLTLCVDLTICYCCYL